MQAKMSDDLIQFDSRFKTFFIYPGNSLYAFSISPELMLEHLYWGKKLPAGYDLRYLSQSMRMSHFNTAEVFDEANTSENTIRDELFTNLQWENLENLKEAWKRSKDVKITDVSDIDAIKQRRVENLSWRMMSKLSQIQCHTSQLSLLPTTSSEQLDSESSVLHASSGEQNESNKINRTIHSRFPNLPPLEIDSSIDYVDFDDEEMANAGSQSMPRLRNSRTASKSDEWPLDIENANEVGAAGGMSPMRQVVTNTPASTPSKGMSIGRKSTSKLNSLQGRTSRRHRAFERSGGKIGKGILNVEYSDHGTGDFRSPSFMVADTFDGSSISPLRYRKHRILQSGLPMPDGMPGLRNLTADDASTLIVTMADIGSGLEVDLIYVVLRGYDAITRRVVIRNQDSRTTPKAGAESKVPASKIIQRAMSLTLDYESTARPFYLVQLSGSWARERYVVETKLNHGMQSFGSVRGVSGHQHNPFAALTIGHPSETTGEVKGFSLVYSGNFLFEAELSETGRLRLNMGIHPMGFEWHLKPGQCFNSPEALLVRSSEGMGGMSRVLHRLLLDKLMAPLPRWAEISPPVLLNSWEANYFDINHDNVIEMAKQGSRIGIDLVVIDDGWFGNREDDTTSLGDWEANLEKFPYGLSHLAQEVNGLGCRLGLWFEPEMVSDQSQLNTDHPDWYLHVPGRPRQLGRNQMVLDLSRDVVRDYLFDAISKILYGANIEYIKWDMNRPLTEVFSLRNRSDKCTNRVDSIGCDDVEGSIWQSETSHRYVLGVYALQRRIVEAFPNVLLENCASGGGRFDPGMLYYSPQIWASDNTDAIARMKIQYGTSIAYPASSIGSHVSCVPNHITGNSTRAKTRGLIAMCGTFGFELDMNHVCPRDKALYREQIAIYKAIFPIIKKGDLYRLWDPFKINFAAWMYVSRDKNAAVVFAFSANSDHWSNLVPRLTLQGLISEADYEICEPLPGNLSQNTGNLMIIETEVPEYQLGYSSAIFSGEILMSAGLPIKFYTLDDAVMFFLMRTGSGASTAQNTPMSRPTSTIHRMNNSTSSGKFSPSF